MKYQQEVIDWVREDISTMLKQHYEEVEDKALPLSPAWEELYAAERAGLLFIFTARTDANELIGYITYLIVPLLHSAGKRAAMSNMLYVAPPYRGKFVGTRLVSFGEEALFNGKNISIFFLTARPEHDFSALSQRAGYTEYERVYMKIRTI
jgi:GNAT superfamily N-acetyltransferase